MDVYGYDIAPLSDTVQSPDEVLRDRESRVTAMHQQVTDRIYRRWLRSVRERTGA
ncbi:MAG: hypothetical protein U5K73_09605 [Halofilum sp. (in: g-proteobacteria)]|nr:hypothetical protein [Halofilum sp. (in: g-proteobacteria)]